MSPCVTLSEVRNMVLHEAKEDWQGVRSPQPPDQEFGLSHTLRNLTVLLGDVRMNEAVSLFLLSLATLLSFHFLSTTQTTTKTRGGKENKNCRESVASFQTVSHDWKVCKVSNHSRWILQLRGNLSDHQLQLSYITVKKTKAQDAYLFCPNFTENIQD